MQNQIKKHFPKVSIITVNFNGRRFLENFFSSLERLTYPNWELIFVDNASQDSSVEYVKKNYPQVKLIENKNNLGFALGNNQAAEIASGKYLFFLNNDTRVHPKLLDILIQKIEKEQKIGIVGCKIMDYKRKKTLHAGIGIDIFGYPIVRRHIFYVEGSALMIKKQLFEKLGGFDRCYFMFHEDIDLAWRVWLRGKEVVALPEAIVYHAVGGTAGGGPKVNNRYYSSYLRRYYSERNNIRTLLKNYQWKTLIIIFPFYLLINLGEIFFWLLMLKFKLIYLYAKAYIWNLANLRDTLGERAKIQKTRVISDIEIIKKMYLGSAKLAALKKIGIPYFK